MATILDAQAEVNAAEGAWARRDLAAVAVRLDAFWKAKAAAWSTDPTVQQALTLMDADAHSIWARMEEKKALDADTDSTERAQHSATAQQAWVKAAQLRAAGGASPRYVKSTTNMAQAAAGLNQWLNRSTPDVRYSTAVKEQAAGLLGSDFLGVPVWAWAAGGALLVVAIATR